MDNIEIGFIITCRLLPHNLPKNPARLWHGRVIRLALEVEMIDVVSVEDGYAGLEESLLIEQIVSVSEQAP